MLTPGVYCSVEETANYRFNGVSGGFAALMRHDGLEKYDGSVDPPQPFDFDAERDQLSNARPSRVEYECLCKAVRLTTPFETVSSGHCCCLSCCKASGSLLWTSLTYKATDVGFEDESQLRVRSMSRQRRALTRQRRSQYGSRYFVRCLI